MTRAKRKSVRLCLFGASPDTGNLGCSALYYGTLHGLVQRLPDSLITAFDNGWGLREEKIQINGARFRVLLHGMRRSKRFHRRETLWNIRVSARLGGLFNPGARAILESQAVVDVTGGDSFTDLYGSERWRNVIWEKRIPMENGVPVILLPQTYGPFLSARSKEVARKIILNAKAAWARDERNFEQFKELLGVDYDPSRHKCGVDVAFMLPAKEPDLPGEFGHLFENKRGGPLIGFNVSGLIYTNPNNSRERFKIVADYREAVARFLRRFLKEEEGTVILIPHVVPPALRFESDLHACRQVQEILESEAKGRVILPPALDDPREVKWLISKLDWFCGTRMHPTIAGLSTGVPTAAVSYSLKTLGVFETCDQGDHVADPRELETDGLVERLWRSWKEREQAKSILAEALPGVLRKSEEQMDDIVACIRREAESPARVS